MRTRDDDRNGQSSVDERRPDRGRRTASRPERRRIPASAAAEAGIRQVIDLTGRDVQGIVSLEPADNGWVVGVEVVEDRRIPSSTDVLALYEAEIDDEGELVSYARRSRYARGKSDRGEAGS
jgi:gas vesicle protein GvpO